MPSKLLMASLAAITLTAAGCGGSAASSSSGAADPGASLGVPDRIYRVKLSGSAERPPASRSAVGDALIALHDLAHELCWRFAHLHGFVAATSAHIHVGQAGTVGTVFVALSTGPHLHHRGCVVIGKRVITNIEKNPRGYYVNIASRRYPNGAVRAQL
jgi:CHRD domain